MSERSIVISGIQHTLEKTTLGDRVDTEVDSALAIIVTRFRPFVKQKNYSYSLTNELKRTILRQCRLVRFDEGCYNVSALPYAVGILL